MPVRKTSSSILRWPGREEIDCAMQAWASRIASTRPDIRAIGYFGSYARGDWGVGSDLDILIIVDDARDPFERRALAFDASALPVPADILVYTPEEFARLGHESFRRETVWVRRRADR